MEMLFIIGGAFAAVVFLKKDSARIQKKRLQKAQEIITMHADELRRRRSQTEYQGNYGTVEDDKWWKEVEFFIERVIKPQVEYIDSIQLIEIMKMISAVTADAIIDRAAPSPIEYEEYIAGALRQSGWQAQTTKASGDQGIDIIAKKNSQTVVLQCKLYSKPVGNAAVQQIIAGKAFQSAGHAAVVTNAGYTPSARQLAAATNVLLLHDSEVPDLERRLILT